MGFFQGLLGNASKASVEDLKKDWGSLFSKDEEINHCYKLVRDWIILTNKRLVLIDYQGITGTRIAIKNIPWRNIVAYEIVTAGIADLNAELYIYVASSPFPVKYCFSSSVNIYEVQDAIADALAQIK